VPADTLPGMAITLPLGGEVPGEVRDVAKTAKTGRLVEEGAAAANVVRESIYAFLKLQLSMLANRETFHAGLGSMCALDVWLAKAQ